jgi:hypothetical protein
MKNSTYLLAEPLVARVEEPREAMLTGGWFREGWYCVWVKYMWQKKIIV